MLTNVSVFGVVESTIGELLLLTFIWWWFCWLLDPVQIDDDVPNDEIGGPESPNALKCEMKLLTNIIENAMMVKIIKLLV